MFGYVNVRNELKDADMEVAELTRLLKEAIERRDQLIEYAPAQSWYQYFLELLGIY